MRLRFPLVALLCAASCNAISGVDDYQFVPPDAPAPDAGAQGGAGGQGGGEACDETSPDCATCQACANDSACEDEVAACVSNMDCLSVASCFAECQDSCAGAPMPQGCISVCVDDCRAMHAAGTAAYDAIIACYIAECPTTCS